MNQLSSSLLNESFRALTASTVDTSGWPRLKSTTCTYPAFINQRLKQRLLIINRYNLITTKGFEPHANRNSSS